jgi:hypothetical protein
LPAAVREAVMLLFLQTARIAAAYATLTREVSMPPPPAPKKGTLKPLYAGNLV